jgi:hypothetical protein
MVNITIKQREAKTITFRLRDSTGGVVDGSTATYKFWVREKYGTTYLIAKTDTDFGTTAATGGNITLNLTTTDTDVRAGRHEAELETDWSPTNVDKSPTIPFVVVESVGSAT